MSGFLRGFLVGVGLGIVIGGFLAYWFEDVLRGPIMRAYDDFALKQIEAEDRWGIQLEDD